LEERIWHRFYDHKVPNRIEFEDIPLSDFLTRAASRYPDAPAVAFLNCTLTYRELKDQADRFATALTAMEVTRGSRVAIHLPNLPQAVIAALGTLSLGAQLVMTNPLYVAREIEHQWNDAECIVAVTADYLYRSTLDGIRDRLCVKNYIVASIPEYLRFPLRQLAPLKLRRAVPPLTAPVPLGDHIHPFRTLLRVTPAHPPRDAVRMDELAALQYTGGTTGVAKGAMLTHGNLSRNVQQMAAWFPHMVDGEEVFLAALPYFHIFGLTVSMFLPVYKAACMLLMPNPRDVKRIVDGIVKQRVTVFPGVPAMFNAINNHPGVEEMDLRSVKYCFSGSAPLALEVQRRFEELTDSKILEGFGLTETSPVTHINPIDGVRKSGSIGIPVPETDSKVMDPVDGLVEQPPGAEGELIIKGPQVMCGYLNLPEETERVLRDGWLYTGDLAVMDEDGYFRIVGRKKDMILASGYNVYPDEIDNVLMEHEVVLEACTIGVPDPKRGETVKSFIVLKPEVEATQEEIVAYCRKNLAAYKVPRAIEFRAELPKSSMLKLLRRVLREEELRKGGGAK
jgi:long-chain acyl-CoA synthetase